MSKFIYTILFSVFLWNNMVAQGHADAFEECMTKSNCGPNDGQCKKGCQNSHPLEGCKFDCKGDGQCMKICENSHSPSNQPSLQPAPQPAPRETAPRETAPMGTIAPLQSAIPTPHPPQHSCSYICSGNPSECNYLSYSADLKRQCRELVGQPDCLRLCRNLICPNPETRDEARENCAK